MRTANSKTDFSQGSVPKNILRMALPLAMAQLVTLLYNMVDRMYIGQMPEEGRLALTGLGLVFPLIHLITGFSNLCGMGSSPLCSMARGAGDQEKAERIMGNAFSMLLFFAVLVMAVIYAFKRPILYLLGASDATYGYACEYLNIYLAGTVFAMISTGMNPFINLQGYAKTGMLTNLLGAVTNIILDPIFIYTFHMGVAGAAWATIISQALSAVWVLYFIVGNKGTLRFRRENLKPDPETVKSIMKMGISPFIMSATNSVVNSTINSTLQQFGGDLWVGVMTVINSVKEISFLILHGVSNGASPVIGYNYGAKLYSRVRQGILFVIKFCIAYSALFWVVINLVPEFFVRIFNSDPELLSAGVTGMHIYFAAYIFMALQASGQQTFLAIGRYKYSTFFSLLRKIIIVLPLTVILPHIGGLGVYGVFLAEPISDILGGGSAFITMCLTVLRPMKKLRDGDEDPKRAH